jgi:hypothetical protein
MAEHDHLRSARHVLLGGDVPAEDRIDAEEAEEVRRHEADLDEAGLGRVAEDALPSRSHHEVLEQPAPLAVVAVVEAVQRGERLRAFAEVVPHDPEPLGRRVRQRLEEDPVQDGEHHGDGSDAEREHPDGGGGEARRAEERAHAVAEVASERAHQWSIVGSLRETR